MTISPDSIVLWTLGPLPVNATIAFTWGIMALLTAVAWLITRRLSSGPEMSRWQNLLEVLVTGMRDQIREVSRQEPGTYLPFVGTLFLYIATSNLLTILPGYSPPTGSLSTTTALAIAVFVAVPLYGLAENGPLAYLRHYVQPTILMLPFNVIGEISRTIALAVRLYGNIMSGTVIVAILLGLTPFLFPVVMQLLGLITGMIQAYIFAVLAMVYIASATSVQARTGRGRFPRPRFRQLWRPGGSMDSVSLIGLISIFTAGLTMALGAIGPALAEGRAVAQARCRDRPAARRGRQHHARAVRRAGDDRIYGDLLLRRGPDPDLCQSVLGRGACSRRRLAMQIDWLTVAAQIVNFLILVWLLRRFLYRPVTNAMARRQERIAACLKQAEERENEAEAQKRAYTGKIAALEKEREGRLHDAREAAARQERQLLDEARRGIDRQRDKWREELRREQEDFSRTLKHELGASAVQIARRALGDLAGVVLERQIVTAFLDRWRELPAGERELFRHASDLLRVSSSFDLDDATRKLLSEALQAPTDIEFARDPGLVCGITLSCAGHKLEWSVDDYLNEAGNRIREQLAASAPGGAETA